MYIAEKVREDALAEGKKPPEHASAQEELKASYNSVTLPVFSRLVFNALNSRSFLRSLEDMTGIKELIPDPYFSGAGIRGTNNGGYLGIDTDYHHHKRMNLERRLNVLMNETPDWKEEYGGALEIWTDDKKARIDAYPSIMNRKCCFSTSSISTHGNPEPVNHPDGHPRLSIALHYSLGMTAAWPTQLCFPHALKQPI